MRKFGFVILVSLFILVSTRFSARANLVGNGDFETLGTSVVNGVTDVPSWTVSDGSYATGIYNSWYLGLGPHSGSAFLWGGAYNGFSASVSQTLVTTPGQKYSLDFWLANTNGNLAANNYWIVQWNNTILDSASNAGDFSYTEKNFTVTGTGSDILKFIFRNEPGAFGLDDVSLKSSTASAVPVPPSVLLFVSGLGWLAVLGRKRIVC